MGRTNTRTRARCEKSRGREWGAKGEATAGFVSTGSTNLGMGKVPELVEGPGVGAKAEVTAGIAIGFSCDMTYHAVKQKSGCARAGRADPMKDSGTRRGTG